MPLPKSMPIGDLKKKNDETRKTREAQKSGQQSTNQR